MILYLLKESFRGFKTAKFSAFASVLTISLALILIAVYFTLSVNSNKLIKSIREKVEVEVFLEDDISVEELGKLKEKIKTIGGIKQLTYISKEEAANIFRKDFGQDMLEIFDSNPLPASLKINLYDEYKSLERITKIKSQIAVLPKVSDIVFPQKNLELIDSNTSGYLFINLIILILISLSSVFLVSNTIRLVIVNRRKIIETLKYIGATNTFIRIPFIIEGIIQGLLGGILSIGLLVGMFMYFRSNFNQAELKFDFIGMEYFIYLLAIGIFLGVFGSLISVRRFLKFKSI